MTENTLKKAKLIQDLAAEHYEQGRQDRCYLWVYRNVILKRYPMSERSFWRYMSIDVNKYKK